MIKKIKKCLIPNKFMLDNYFYPASDWVTDHYFLYSFLSLPMAPVSILYFIWYIISLIDDAGDFIWFKILDIAIEG